VIRTRSPIDQHSVAGLDLVEKLPQQQRHADHVDKTEDWMVVRAGELEALPRLQPQRRVVARVEDPRNRDRSTQPVEHLERGFALGVRRRPPDEILNLDGPVRRLHTRAGS
jgi:hypothetical protein